MYVIGKKGVGYFRFRGVPMQAASWQGFSEVPPYEKAEEIGRTLIADFADGDDRRAALRVHGLPLGVHAPGDRQAVPARSRPRRSVHRTGAAVPAEYLFEPEPAEILDSPAAAVRRHEGVRGAAGVGGLGERGDGGGR